MAEKLKVFLCHASENKPIVEELYDDLVAAGYEPWLDKEILLYGQHWEREIKLALKQTDAVIVCFSAKLVKKEGYIQKELRLAEAEAEEKLPDSIFLIPLKLDACDVPFEFQHLHWGDYTAPDAFEDLVAALNKRARQLGKREGKAKKKHP
ncbi:MAG: toll/interleukin-1 receptor domain-containing protein [Anaerolineales bacterium]|nr:toll/interleukin-1 receptor domain-containing protein [Anaerolineales bacterium]